MVFVDYPNNAKNEPDFYQFREDVPSILRTLKTSRRFTTVVKKIYNYNTIGSHDGNTNDELIIPTLIISV